MASSRHNRLKLCLLLQWRKLKAVLLNLLIILNSIEQFLFIDHNHFRVSLIFQ